MNLLDQINITPEVARRWHQVCRDAQPKLEALKPWLPGIEFARENADGSITVCVSGPDGNDLVAMVVQPGEWCLAN